MIAAFLLAAVTPNADAIFAAAQSAAAQIVRPVYASYTVDVAWTNGSKRLHDEWQTVEDIRAATVIAGLFSAQEIANPAVPSGTNVVVQGAGAIDRAPERDPIGNVAFAVDQTFGIAPPRVYLSGSELNQPAPRSPMFRFTGGAVGSDKPYRVKLAGTVAGANGPEYHLLLTPNGDPSRYRLRELWIAAPSMTVDSAVVAGIGDRPPAAKVPWKVTFATHDGAPYLAREAALAPLDYGPAGVLTDVSVDFDDVQFSAEYPPRYAIGRQATDPLHDP